MYKIYSDNLLIYDPRTNDYQITEGSYTGAVNASGTLTFTITKDHPHYGLVDLMKSTVTLYDDDRLIFRGRPYAPNVSLFQMNQIECEGELAFFNDTYYPPFDYFGDVETLFTQVVDFHNTQVEEDRQIKVGIVNVTNSTDEGNITRASEEYMIIWDVLREKFFESELGGFLHLRHEQDGTYIDYLEDLNFTAGQNVEQTINLIDATKQTTSEDLATVVVPLGATIQSQVEGEPDRRLTIESVNEGKIYLESQEGIQKYGRIVRIFTHDDITIPENLLLAGQADLGSALGALQTVELTAADLSRAGYQVDPFALGTYVAVKIQSLDIDERMLVKEISINLLEPAGNELTLGRTRRSLTDDQLKTTRGVQNLAISVYENAQEIKRTASELRRETQSQIQQTSENIMSTVTEAYYNMADMDLMVQQLQTLIEQTASDITFTFNQFVASQEETNDTTADTFEEWRRYIRFVEGDIEIGIVDNPMMLRLENNRIVFLEDNVEVAYWENRNFYAVDGEFLRSLRLGNFVFYPRESGNLSFFKSVQEVEPEPPEPPEGEEE